MNSDKCMRSSGGGGDEPEHRGQNNKELLSRLASSSRPGTVDSVHVINLCPFEVFCSPSC